MAVVRLKYKVVAVAVGSHALSYESFFALHIATYYW
jgi:hypothetical protein